MWLTLRRARLGCAVLLATLAVSIPSRGQQQQQPKQLPSVQPKEGQPTPTPTPETTPSTTQPPTAQPGTTQPGAGQFGTTGGPSAGVQLSSSQQSVGAQGQAVPGTQALGLGSTDLGSLLGQSSSATGVETLKRQPIANETRIRGEHLGETLTWADGVYWFPARYDLDTMLSKIDSGNVKNAVVVKGPYSVQYGPGFSFIDVETNGSPRYQDGFEQHGRLSSEYKWDGRQFYGRAGLWGGDYNWGYSISYDQRAGKSYESGNGESIPSGYDSRDVNAVFGFDLTPCDHIEVGYLRLDQTGVQFPGQVFDTSDLLTNSFRGRYTSERKEYYDRLTIDGYYNRTTLDGNAQNPAKRVFIPNLGAALQAGFTNIAQSSAGYRMAITWGVNQQAGNVPSQQTCGVDSQQTCASQTQASAVQSQQCCTTQQSCPIQYQDTCKTPQLTIGHDFRYLNGQLNEFDIPSGLAGLGLIFNNPIPPSYQLDTGLFAEYSHPFSECFTMKVGARGDFATTNIDGQPIFLTVSNTQFFGVNNFERDYGMWMAYTTAEYKVNDYWTLTSGGGHAERPPTQTELYARGPFLAILQQGFTRVIGDPELSTEKLWQIDFGTKTKYDYFRAGANGFCSFVQDYITYMTVPPQRVVPTLNQALTNALTVQYTNTDLAILTGFELYSEYDYNDYVTPFMTMSYVAGRDMTRDQRGVMNPLHPEQGAGGSSQEPLPGIAPLESRVGVRWHEGVTNPHYGLEFSARMVAAQERVAQSLGEVPSSGFVVYDTRGYWQAREHLMLVAGINNIFNRNYREHLDLRTGVPLGTGVLQPGINPYVGVEYTW
jgi:iron complex outermembrane recepter protein